MRILGCGDVVVARVQNIGFCLVGIIAFQLFLVKGRRYGFACARFQNRGLGIADQLDRGFLHTVFLVVLGVGALCVNLHDLFACHITGVRHGNADGAGVAGPSGGVVLPVKSSQGQTVTKRILYGF